MSRAVVLLSGGIDSAVAAAHAVAEFGEVSALTLDYGQRNVRELSCARKIAQHLQISEHFVVEVNLAGWGGSLLTERSDCIRDVSDPVSTLATHVPGRNTVFIAMALSLAEARGAGVIYLGFNAADRHHRDTHPKYLEAFEQLALLSVNKVANVPRLVAPLIDDDKLSIVQRALDIGIPIEKTWSCYGEGDEPCGACHACRLRDGCLIAAGRSDLATPSGVNHYCSAAGLHVQSFWRWVARDYADQITMLRP